MARSLMYTATTEDSGKRLDAVMAGAGLYSSRSAAARFIEDGKVFVNGQVEAKKYPVQANDVLVYEEAVENDILVLHGEDIPLDIRYEDEYLLVISKQAGLICHPSYNHDSHTLVNGLIYKYGHENLAHVQGDDRPGIVHRLDGDTTGLMLCAKDDEVGFALQDAIRLKNVDRRYLALVHGTVSHDTGEIDAPIARNRKTGVSMLVSDDIAAREALTSFKVLERFEAGNKDDGYSLVECKLFTGRTHQIRVHMKYIHHCIVGDFTYGAFGPQAQLGLSRQFLHSYHLAFTHPVTGEYLDFTDHLPEDLTNAYHRLDGRTLGRTEVGEKIISEIGL